MSLTRRLQITTWVSFPRAFGNVVGIESCEGVLTILVMHLPQHP